eukprot:Blabericola_migrator_1__11740@NODE_70_length_15323_cov_105_367593_g63_i0_p1_GENE_NODE_70_length_15323_cov_105_367593_g63_i0NODE_70_length_15323_cov_105_367593_g63_i0_p1_ORF_typecomplete_len1056_score142_05eIF3_p135/PF12807_7/0_22eIF3_p135/PF12807_7/9_8e02_NODE_70_length_15323_cov_105_367593_g63_i0829611463
MNEAAVWDFIDLEAPSGEDAAAQTEADFISLRTILDDERSNEEFCPSHVFRFPSESWLQDLHSSTPINDFEYHEISRTLQQGSSAQFSNNWFQRITWTLQRVINVAFTETSLLHRRRKAIEESLFQTEVALFHKSAQKLGSLLAAAVIGEVLRAPKLVGFGTFRHRDHPQCFSLHCPKFSEDRLYVKDSICFTVIRGGHAMNRESVTPLATSCRVSKASAVKCYRNEVNASEHYNNAIASLPPPLLFAPLICGMIRWSTISIFYEPLCLPLIHLKAAPSALLSSKLAWWRTRFSLIPDLNDDSVDVPWREDPHEAPIHWFADGRSDTLLCADTPMSTFLKSFAAALNTQVYGLPFGSSDIAEFLGHHHIPGTPPIISSVEPCLYWTHVEGLRGLLHARCVMECLPLVILSPFASALERTSFQGSGESRPARLMTELSSLHRSLPSPGSPIAIDIPETLLRRVPATLLRLQCKTLGPYYSTLRQWAAAGGINPYADVATAIDGHMEWMISQCINGTHGVAHAAHLLSKWAEGLGMNTRELYKYIWTAPNFPVYLMNAVERDMVAKVVKRILQRKLEIERSREVERWASRSLISGNMGSRKNELISLFVSRTCGVVDHLESWMTDFVRHCFGASQEEFSRSVWDTLIPEEFEAVYGIPLKGSSFIARLSPAHFLQSFRMATGIKVTSTIDFEDNLTSTVAWVRTRIITSLESGFKKHDFVAYKGLRSLTSSFMEPKAWVAGMWGTPGLQICVKRLEEYIERRKRYSNVVPSQQVGRRAVDPPSSQDLSTHLYRDFLLDEGMVNEMYSKMIHQAWPCTPLCLPDQSVLSKKKFDGTIKRSQCARLVTATHVFDTLLLILRSWGANLSQTSLWCAVTLYYGYIYLQHDVLCDAYVVAHAVLRRNLAVQGFSFEAKLLLFQIMIKRGVNIDQILAAHALLRQYFSAKPTMKLSAGLTDVEYELPVPPLFTGAQNGCHNVSTAIDLLMIYALLKVISKTPEKKRNMTHAQYKLFVSMVVRLSDRALTNSRSSSSSIAAQGSHWIELLCLKTRVRFLRTRIP